MSRGFFAVGIYRTKTPENVGTLWRAAHLYGAAFVYTVGHRYGTRQASDTTNARLHIPLFHFADLDDLIEHLPHSTPLVGVELDPRATALSEYTHPMRAAYLLGAEDDGLPPSVVDRCHDLVQIEAVQPWSMNVAVAGSIVMHQRHVSRVAVSA